MRVKLLVTDKFTFAKTQSLKDPHLVIFVPEVDLGHLFLLDFFKKIECEIKLKNYPQSLVSLHM